MRNKVIISMSIEQFMSYDALLNFISDARTVQHDDIFMRTCGLSEHEYVKLDHMKTVIGILHNTESQKVSVEMTHEQLTHLWGVLKNIENSIKHSQADGVKDFGLMIPARSYNQLKKLTYLD